MQTPSKRTQHCNKRFYASFKAAQGGLTGTINRKAKQLNPIVTYMRVYKCEYCSGYHVGRVKGQIMWDIVAQRDADLRKLRHGAQHV